MKKRFKKSNIIFLVIILLLIIPQTRQPIQVWMHKGLSYINQSTLIDSDERVEVAYKEWKLRSDNNTIIDFQGDASNTLNTNRYADVTGSGQWYGFAKPKKDLTSVQSFLEQMKSGNWQDKIEN